MRFNVCSGSVKVSAMLLAICFTFNSCVTKYRFATSTTLPAAEGYVKVKQDKNKNYNIDLNIRRLVDSKKLLPPKEMYVVWIETEQNGFKSIGRLKTSQGMSNSLRGSLQTVTTFKPVSLFITGENEAGLPYPAGEVLLRTNSF